MFYEGEYVTVKPVDTDPWILHMQRHVTVASRHPGGYLVRLESADPRDCTRGPIPEDRLLPGWVEDDGRVRVTRTGRRA